MNFGPQCDGWHRADRDNGCAPLYTFCGTCSRCAERMQSDEQFRKWMGGPCSEATRMPHAAGRALESICERLNPSPELAGTGVNAIVVTVQGADHSVARWGLDRSQARDVFAHLAANYGPQHDDDDEPDDRGIRWNTDGVDVELANAIAAARARLGSFLVPVLVEVLSDDERSALFTALGAEMDPE